MHQTDIERFAFLYLCSEKDKAILTGNERMTFGDFDRLTYLTDFFGFKHYNLELWNKYAGQFREQFEALIHFINDDYPENMDSRSYDEGYRLHDMWIHDFCKNAPNEAQQKWLLRHAVEIGKENGWDLEGCEETGEES